MCPVGLFMIGKEKSRSQKSVSIARCSTSPQPDQSNGKYSHILLHCTYIFFVLNRLVEKRWNSFKKTQDTSIWKSCLFLFVCTWLIITMILCIILSQRTIQENSYNNINFYVLPHYRCKSSQKYIHIALILLFFLNETRMTKHFFLIQHVYIIITVLS